MSRTRQTPFTDPAEFSDNPRPVVTLANDYPSGYEIEPHRHARAQLVYAAQGVMTVTVAAGSWVVPPQRAVWMPAGIIDDPSVLHQAAIDGQGVALTSENLIRGELAAGRLVKPFDVDLDRDNAYYLVAPPRAFERPNVQAFRDFLLAEIEAEGAGADGV